MYVKYTGIFFKRKTNLIVISFSQKVYKYHLLTTPTFLDLLEGFLDFPYLPFFLKQTLASCQMRGRETDRASYIIHKPCYQLLYTISPIMQWKVIYLGSNWYISDIFLIFFSFIKYYKNWSHFQDCNLVHIIWYWLPVLITSTVIASTSQAKS